MLKLYVIVDSSLGMSHQAVQAAHAVAEFCLKEKTPWDNGTLVVLKDSNIPKWKDYLECGGKKVISFHEPDRGNQLTAIAGIGWNELVRDLPLL